MIFFFRAVKTFGIFPDVKSILEVVRRRNNFSLFNWTLFHIFIRSLWKFLSEKYIILTLTTVYNTIFFTNFYFCNMSILKISKFYTNLTYPVSDSSPELVYWFSEQTLQPGPTVSLKCVAVGSPPPHFTWTLDGFPIPENTRSVY